MSTPNFQYSEAADVGPGKYFQLEVWVPKGRKGGAWARMVHDIPHAFRTWRKVLPGHKHKDKLAHSIASVKAGYARTRAEVCEAYCAWARAKGLTRVTVFREGMSIHYANAAGLEFRTVDVSDFIGDAPAPEIEQELAA